MPFRRIKLTLPLKLITIIKLIKCRKEVPQLFYFHKYLLHSKCRDISANKQITKYDYTPDGNNTNIYGSSGSQTHSHSLTEQFDPTWKPIPHNSPGVPQAQFYPSSTNDAWLPPHSARSASSDVCHSITQPTKVVVDTTLAFTYDYNRLYQSVYITLYTYTLSRYTIKFASLVCSLGVKCRQPRKIPQTKKKIQFPAFVEGGFLYMFYSLDP